MFKSGFVGLVGRPNVGKSTLLNSIMNEKIAIVSATAQTTRNAIRGIYTTDEEQIVFVDTPGIHKANHKLGKFMTDLSLSIFQDMDAVLMLVEADSQFGKGDKFILDKLTKACSNVIVVINKIDKITDEELITKIKMIDEMYDISEIVPISALNNQNIERLLMVLKKYLMPGPKYYDDNNKTDFSQRFMFQEIIREKVLYHTREEIPHSVAVVIEDFYIEDNRAAILGTIIVERDSQKGILIGKKGSMIKQISSEARAEIKKNLKMSVFLEMQVRVEKNWRNNPDSLAKYGYHNR